MKIKKLPSSLIDKIAAGEVVERPASVVKELVENALDADANFVKVEIKGGGKDSILVRDDGVGMDREDAKHAFERHSTSKLSSVEDLTSIKTFGFRGEALSSIAAVSKVVLQTKERGSVEGTQIVITGGKIDRVSSCAHPEGTTVKVSNLFYNIPARRKFLKTSRTEFKHIREWLTAQAVALSENGFSLSHNGRDILHFPAEQGQEERIEEVLGSLEDFVPVSGESDYTNLDGFVSLPGKARKRRKNQYLYVNGRYLRNKTVGGALRKAYSDLLPSSLNPPYIMFVDVREDLVDVNIHPRKEEIKFINSSRVYNLVLNSVKTALSMRLEQGGSDFSVRLENVQKLSSPRKRTGVAKDRGFSFDSQERPISRATVKPVDILDRIRDQEQVDDSFPILQIANLYLVVAKEDGVLLIDQHAAEERILLEEFLARYKSEKEKGAGQKLLIPQVFELDKEDFGILVESENILERLGFEFELSDEEGLVKLVSVPAVLAEREIKPILYGFLDDLSEDQNFGDRETTVAPQVYDTLATLACRSAVKKGDRLSLREKENIVNRLQSLDSRGATCPHGRPTWIKLSLSRLDSMFKRA
ncbi:MAG: DNA mismatch repair endonuclease MutL [Patescibacteria group bacterium]|nr:DNA mismatch repair endonuclease MutL [Patescibacteria group bacterium]